MTIKSMIAAVDAEKLAKEAKKRARVKSKQDQAEIPDLVKRAFKKPLTQAQIKQELLKKKWRPPGYISIWELLDLTGAYRFNDWSNKNLELIASPPKCLQVSDALDLGNIEELIWYALSNDFIKEGIKQPPSISEDDSGVWQDDWLYLHRVGKFNGARSKEDAIDGWLEEVRFIVQENRQYNAALKRVEQLKIFLRDMLYAGKIKAVRVVGEDLEPMAPSYWLDDNFAHSLDLLPAEAEILFDHKSVQKVIEAINKRAALSQKGLVTVSTGQDVTMATKAVYAECRARGDKLNNQELQELINRVLKNKGKVLPKSWHKTKADIPPDLKRQRGEHSKCSLIRENWPKSESK